MNQRFLLIVMLLGCLQTGLLQAQNSPTIIHVANQEQFFAPYSKIRKEVLCRKVSDNRTAAGVVRTRNFFGLEIRRWENYARLLQRLTRRAAPTKILQKIAAEKKRFVNECKKKRKELETLATPVPDSTPQPSATPLVNPTPTPLPSATATPVTPPQNPSYIRCGGEDYIDQFGRLWISDEAFVLGSSATYSSTHNISDTDVPVIFQSERYDSNLRYRIPLPNGSYEVHLLFAELFYSSPNQRVFDARLEGAELVSNLDIVAAVGPFRALRKVFQIQINDGALNLNFSSDLDQAKLSGIEIYPRQGSNPYLHAVIEAPDFLVDFDQNGTESFSLNGNSSHTHEPGGHLSGYLWREGQNILGTQAQIESDLALGAHLITLEIFDQNSPPGNSLASKRIDLYPAQAVGGALTSYYHSGPSELPFLIDSLPAKPDYQEVNPALKLEARAGKIAGSPFSSNTVVRLLANLNLAQDGSYDFQAVGGSLQRIWLDGVLLNGSVDLSAGFHQLEARFAVPDIDSLPLQVLYSFNAAEMQSIPQAFITHDQSQLEPFITSLPASGFAGGGEAIKIKGMGFFPAAQLKVHWGDLELSGASLEVLQNEINLTSPPGQGSISVSVETPQGTSNLKSFSYYTDTPINFSPAQNIASVALATQASWGPDGRLYVATLYGEIKIFEFDPDYNIISEQSLTGVSAASNNTILGIAFNPLDPPSPVKLYISHSQLYAEFYPDCTPPQSAFPYSGQVSVLEGPNFDTVQPLITGLPVSNHDHGINGLTFDNYGNLFIAVGGNTNAGVISCQIGLIPESPFSAAVLKAELWRTNFSGAIQYTESESGLPNQDARFGDVVDPSSREFISVYAHGLRNAFDLVFTTQNKLYTSDNGPNEGFGVALGHPDYDQEPGPNFSDELNLLAENHYYGHPNQNRGRYDQRQNFFQTPYTPSDFGEHTAPLMPESFAASTNGLDQYRSHNFDSKLFGQLLAKRFTGSEELYNIELDQQGRNILQLGQLLNTPGLDIVTSPGGSLLFTDLNNSALSLSRPIDIGLEDFDLVDIFPWRALAGADVPFVISGVGFNPQAQTHVHVGEEHAFVSEVTPTTIKGYFPAVSEPSSEFLDIEVHSGVNHAVLPKAFRYVFAAGQGKGSWQREADMPSSLLENAAAVVNGVLYIVGEGGGGKTFAYDPVAGTWLANLATRPFVGHHHSAQAINGKLYLFGGLTGSSGNKTQIYDPQTNSWSLGADIPFDQPSGAGASALISGLVYYAGGNVGQTATNQAAVYDPVHDQWSIIAPIPSAEGLHHAAAGTDGSKFYLFGGRIGANTVSQSKEDVYIYDPSSNTWQSSLDPNSPIPPMPLARAGMGQALFFRGELYVIGGESLINGLPQAFSRVDAFNPQTLSWREETALSVPRHGIFPVLLDGNIAIAGGAESHGSNNPSVRLEIFHQ